LNGARWHAALTLSERLTLLRSGSSPALSEEALEKGRRRLERWRSRECFSHPGMFDRRLQMAGATEDELVRALAAPPEAWQEASAGNVPPWLAHLLAALHEDLPMPPLPLGLAARPNAGFIKLFEPLVGWWSARLAAAVGNDLLPQCLEPILHRLLALVSKTAVLEVRVAGLREQLQGDTAESRYASFLQRLASPQVRIDLLQEYPVLARLAGALLEQWYDGTREFMLRVTADAPLLAEHFHQGKPLGPVQTVRAALSDPHGGGRHIWMVRFQHGPCMVYKPRALDLEEPFGDLVAWLNCGGQTPPLRCAAVLPRSGYGWMEYVSAEQQCQSDEEVDDFYRREGSWLAVMHALAASDVHCENLLAVGAHPILIDLETLCQPLPVHADPADADGRAQELLCESVLDVGLLPTPIWNEAMGQAVDVSGMGAGPLGTPVLMLPSVVEAGTDRVRYEPQAVSISHPQHQARCRGAVVDVRTRVRAVEAGFDTTYRQLWHGRHELSDILQRLWGCETRWIPRPSQAYASLHLASQHPAFLQDALDYERQLDELWAGLDERHWLVGLIASEQTQMRRGDIPSFYTRPATGQVHGLTLQWSGKARSQQRLARFGETDLSLQKWLIRVSLAGPSVDGTDAPPTAPANALGVARAVADRLSALAVRGPDTASWLGTEPVGPQAEAWRAVVAGSQLYDGLPGIVLFLARAGAVAGEAEYHHMAELGLESLHRRALDRIAGVGAFEGWGGLIYLWTHLGVLWQRDDLLDRAAQGVQKVGERLEKDAYLDVIAGAAGAIPCLLGLHSWRPRAGAEDMAVRCGEWLMQQGCEGLRFQRGFSHGAAGLAWALFDLYERTTERRFLDAACDATRREMAHLSDGRWTDDDRAVSAWCHGAPGIAVSRARAWRCTGQFGEAVENAVAAVAECGTGHSLCHGALGNIDCLLLASDLVQGGAWRQAVLARADGLVQEVAARGWQCSHPGHVEVPGLMTGLAGIGYGFLRLACPERVPSVLGLHPASPG
jgi:type 2 lantibiotic biosynthesis protein LanM